jgi:hypothetical protein
MVSSSFIWVFYCYPSGILRQVEKTNKPITYGKFERETQREYLLTEQKQALKRD